MTYHAASENGISHPAKNKARCFGKQNHSSTKIMATKHYHFAAKIKVLAWRLELPWNLVMGGFLGLDIKN